jgi:hypothetical protein
MRTRLTLDVSAFDRYVVARYFAVAATDRRDKVRTRATRAQVKRFVQAALRSAVKEQAALLRGRRSRGTVARLQVALQSAEELVAPVEQQQSLAW